MQKSNFSNILNIIIIILAILNFGLIKAEAHTFHCPFDKLYANIDRSHDPHQKPDELMYDNSHGQGKGRIMQGVSRSNIRITLNTNDLATIKAPVQAGVAQTTTANLNFIKRAMQITQSFYQTRLKVTPLVRVQPPNDCFGAVPANDVNFGISSSDLHIYVRYITDNSAGASYVATGASCKTITTPSLPDSTFQRGRPTVGRILFNTFNAVDGKGLTNRFFASLTATTIHQTMHILGFDSSLYNTYLDPSTGNVYTSPILDHVRLDPGRAQNYILKTPFVTAWAKSFFNCPTIDGMALQNEDVAGVGSHWQRLAMYDEVMTATQLGPQKGFSGLTYALLKDMGWYVVDDTWNDTTNYGQGLGCDFYNKACNDSTPRPKYFCDATAEAGTTSCSTNFLGKASCTKETAAMTDGCGIYGSYLNCVDSDQSDDGLKSYTFQQYTTTSFCIQSTYSVSTVSISQNFHGRCYRYQCLSNKIEFYVGSYTIQCLNSQAGVKKIMSQLSGGYLQCPSYPDFCENSRKICPNWCSQNGFCTRGICNCYPGFYGADCSINSCTSGQFYDTTTNTCVNICPAGTYSNTYSRACLPCGSICGQCRDEPHICTQCVSTPTNRKYYWVTNGSCVSTCPSSTFQTGDQCQDCNNNSPNFCLTCNIIATNCTSCSSGFLQPNFTCLGTCTGSTSLYDVINNKCVSSCTDNLVYYSNCPAGCPSTTDGSCNYCATGYKFTGNQTCLATCPDKYYSDPVRKFCQICDSTCLRCRGPYPEECTACDPNTVNKFLLQGSICVSLCPLGFYEDTSQLSCTLCDPNLNCMACSINITNSAIYCNTCKYSFYLQANNTCLPSCDNGYFANTWNHTCDKCSTACGNCTSGTSDACIDCNATSLFLSNSSGKYCLSTCPTNYYYQSGGNCLNCYSTCLTCNGSTSSNCITCIQGLFLSAGMCRYICPAAYFPKEATGRCESCNSNCAFCFGPTVDNCTACISGLVLNNFTCTTSCPAGLPVNQWGVCSQKYNLVFYIAFLLVVIFT